MLGCAITRVVFVCLLLWRIKKGNRTQASDSWKAMEHAEQGRERSRS